MRLALHKKNIDNLYTVFNKQERKNNFHTVHAK